MNSYEYLPEKWTAATAHLTMAENGAYHRLVDWCYANESALPEGIEAQCNIAGARTKLDQQAVEFVVTTYFESTPHGMVQRKANRIITTWLEGEPAREAERQLAKERKRRSRERQAQMLKALKDAGVDTSPSMGNGALLKLAQMSGLAISEDWIAPDPLARMLGSVTRDMVDEGKDVTGNVTRDERDGHSVTEPLSRVTPVTCDSGIPLTVSRVTEGEPVGDEEQSQFTRASVPGISNTNTNTNTEIQLAPFGRSSREPARGCEDAVELPLSEPASTRRGMAGMALKAGGLGDFNLSDPMLLKLLDAGVTDEELKVSAAEATARGKGFRYALAIAKGRRDEAAAMVIAPRVPSLIEQFAPSIAAQHSTPKRGSG